jgi:anti-sigma28 factor (negative regulator of flagellin synthesis)
MKVNDASSGAISGAGKPLEIQVPANATGGKKTSGASSDQVQLSSLSSQLSALQPDSPQRAARVEQLAAMVSTGSYSASSIAVSQSIVRYMGG